MVYRLHNRLQPAGQSAKVNNNESEQEELKIRGRWIYGA